MDRLRQTLGDQIDDPDQDIFLLFSQDIPSANSLGLVDAKAAELDIDIGGKSFTVQQSPGLLTSNKSQGTTGAVLWKVTPPFAHWIVQPDNVLFAQRFLTSSSNILELGCGVSGLVAVSLAHHVAKYIASDLDYVLKTLRRNIEANTAPNRGKAKASKKQPSISNIETFALDWETTDVAALPTSLNLGSGNIDAIIACDCIYNEALIEPFVTTCVDICRLNADAEHPTICIVAQQLRSPDVLESWLTAFCRNFSTWRIPDDLLSKDLGQGSGFVVHIGILLNP